MADRLKFLRSGWGRALLVGLVLILLTLTAVQPFTRGVMPLTDDGLLHLYRIVILDHSLRHDAPLWPRYSSGIAYGYGAPLFNFYSPLVYHALRLLHLAGLSYVQAWLWGMVLCILAGAAGAYHLGRVWLGPVGGIVTAAAFVYSPYFLFDAVTRGTTSEVAALALLPWVMWAFWRLAASAGRPGGRRDFLLAVGLLAAFIPVHNVITLHGGLLLALYCAFLGLYGPARDRTARARSLARMLLAGVLAVGMTAFFWGPALAEVTHVRINLVAANLPHVNAASHLLTPGELFALPPTADPTQLQAPIPIALGWPELILGAVGLVLAFRAGDRPRRALLVFAAVLVAALVYLNTQQAAWVWQTVPLFAYSQFPWRTLGQASLLLAILAGAGVAQVAQRIPSPLGRAVWVGLALAVILAYGLPWLYRADLPEVRADSIADFQDYERATQQVAASSYGEYLPAWNRAALDPDRLRDRFAAAEVIPRLEPQPGVTVESAAWQGTAAVVTFTASDAATLVFDWLYVPGWTAALDGEARPVTPTDPHGFVSVAVPAGRHALELRLGPTPLQTAAETISLGAVLILAALLTVGWRRVARLFPAAGEQAGAAPEPATGVQGRLLVTAAVVGAAVFLGKVLILDHADTPFKRERFAQGVAAGVDVPLEANFDHQIVLLGADLPGAVVSGGTARLALYWRLYGAAIDTDYSSRVVLLDPAGSVVAEYGSFMPGGLATRHWLPGCYVQERLDLAVPPGTPPGVYTLEAGLYQPDTLHALNRINEDGNPADVKVTVGTVTVTRPASPAVLDIAAAVNRPVTAELTLLGVDPLPQEADAGQEVAVVWHWQADARPSHDYRARLVWSDQDGEAAAATPAIPLTPGYPADQWQAGDAWTGRGRLYVPGRLAAGRYTVAVALVDSAGVEQGDPVVVGEMQVRTPVRTYALPEMQHPLAVTWANGITLLGYDRSVGADGAIHVTLYWQTRQDLTTGLHLFVHLIDAADHIVAQWDGVPVDWTRPTPGWAPGEVIATHHTFTVPEGRYTLRTGWYDPTTGERTPLSDGGDFLLLPESAG